MPFRSSFLDGRDNRLVDRPEDEFWWHSTPLPDGGRTRSRQEFQETQFRIWDAITTGVPEGFAGRRVLDVGSADGFFSLAAWAAGAAKVTAIDADYIGWPANLSFLAKSWDADIEIVTGDFRVHPLPHQFDAILLLGVLYHAPDVFGLIRRAHDLLAPNGKLIIETQMSQDTTSPYPLFEASSDIYPTAAGQGVEAIDKVGVSNFLFPNTWAIYHLAHMYRFASSESIACEYSTISPGRKIFVFTKLDPAGPRWVPPVAGRP